MVQTAEQRARRKVQDGIRQAVRRGVELLDQYGPSNWDQQVSPAVLEMSDSNQCVLGQVYKDFSEGTRALSGQLPEDHPHADDFPGGYYGFDYPGINEDVMPKEEERLRRAVDACDMSDHDYWYLLGRQWERVLAARGKEKASASTN